METNWPSEQGTGPTGTLVVICIIFCSRYFFNQALTVNLLVRFEKNCFQNKIEILVALIFIVTSRATLI